MASSVVSWLWVVVYVTPVRLVSHSIRLEGRVRVNSTGKGGDLRVRKERERKEGKRVWNIYKARECVCAR